MNGNEMRERLILPVLIPVGSLAFVGALAMGMASVLLNVPHNIATGVALMVAFNFLVLFTVAALKPKISPFLKLAGLGIGILPLVMGGAVAMGIVEVNDPHAVEEVAAPSVDIAAQSLNFDLTELKVPAGEEFEIHFNNAESQPHNVSILAAAGSADVKFRGDIITGPKEITYTVPAVEPGTYYFQCDVHPTMKGDVIAEEGAGGEAEAAGGEAAH